MYRDTFFHLREKDGFLELGDFSADVRYEVVDFDWNCYSQSRGILFSGRNEAYADWLSAGRGLGCEFSSGRNSVLKIILKVKDEPELLEAWIRHHAAIVGYHNLIILDCGSVDAGHLALLEKYRSHVMVVRYRKYYDHIHAVHSNHDFFRLISTNCKYMTILDADEFLVRRTGNVLGTDGIADFLFGSDELLYCGTWIWSSSPPSGSTVLDGGSDVEFSISESKIRSGVVSGKSIVHSKSIFDIRHLGHNMHVAEVMDAMTPGSFGDFFVLHIKDLHPDIVRRRVSKHLVAKGVLPTGLAGEEAVVYLKEKMDAGQLSQDSVSYAKKFIECDKAALGEEQPFSLSLDALRKGVAIDGLENCVANFPFWDLRSERLKGLREVRK